MQVTDELLYRYSAQARDIWLASLPQKDEVPAFSCSKRFQRRMNALLYQQSRSPRVTRFLRDMKRIVAIFLIAVTIAFAGLMTVEAVRQKVIEFVVHVYHELTQYEYSSDKEASALPELRFDYLPAGMELMSDKRPIETSRYITWEDGEGYYLCLDVSAHDKKSTETRIIDTEDAEITTCQLRGIEMTVIMKNGMTVIWWIEEDVVFFADSNIELSELEQVINGLIIINN